MACYGIAWPRIHWASPRWQFVSLIRQLKCSSGSPQPSWQTVHAGNARTCWINSCNLEIINEKKNKDSVNLARSTIRVFVDHFLHVHVKSGMVDCFVHLFTSSCQSHCDWVTAQSRTFQISTLSTSQWSLEIASQTKAGFLGFESLLCECDGPLWHKVNV